LNIVIPAKAGIQLFFRFRFSRNVIEKDQKLDSRIRGNDGIGDLT
jgi:hypothetical protein